MASYCQQLDSARARRSVTLGHLSQRGYERFTVQNRVEDGVQIVTITGDADIYASATIGAVLEKLADGLPIAVDLRKCNYIDSAMVSKLIAMRKRTRSQIRLVVDHRSVVARVIDLTQIATIMPVVATVEEAKAQLMP